MLDDSAVIIHFVRLAENKWKERSTKRKIAKYLCTSQLNEQTQKRQRNFYLLLKFILKLKELNPQTVQTK